MCARRRSHFLSLRRKKVTQERATPLSASPCAALRGNLRCSVWAGFRSNSPSAQTVASPDPPSPALLGADRGEDAEQPNSRTAEQPNSPKSIERFRADRPCWFYPSPIGGRLGWGPGAGTVLMCHRASAALISAPLAPSPTLPHRGRGPYRQQDQVSTKPPGAMNASDSGRSAKRAQAWSSAAKARVDV